MFAGSGFSSKHGIYLSCLYGILRGQVAERQKHYAVILQTQHVKVFGFDF